jgi:hypothetical protein
MEHWATRERCIVPGERCWMSEEGACRWAEIARPVKRFAGKNIPKSLIVHRSHILREIGHLLSNVV